MLSSVVMDRVASLLNDTAKTQFTYAVQVPYMNIAVDELQEAMEANNVPASNEVSTIFVITTAMKDIGGGTGPALPVDLMEIQGAYERSSGSTEDFQIMSKVEFLPPFTVLTEALIYWSWRTQVISFLGATTPRDVRLNYIGAVIPTIVDQNTNITLFNARSFLTFRTAALCAQFIGENKSRADELNLFAFGDPMKGTTGALDRFLSINTKGEQSIATRKRPFMSSYKVRSGY